MLRAKLQQPSSKLTAIAAVTASVWHIYMTGMFDMIQTVNEAAANVSHCQQLPDYKIPW